MCPNLSKAHCSASNNHNNNLRRIDTITNDDFVPLIGIFKLYKHLPSVFKEKKNLSGVLLNNFFLWSHRFFLLLSNSGI